MPERRPRRNRRPASSRSASRAPRGRRCSTAASGRTSTIHRPDHQRSTESSIRASAQAVDPTAAATANVMPAAPSRPASFEIRDNGVRSISGHQNHASAATVATAAPATIAMPARRVRHMNSAMLATTQAKGDARRCGGECEDESGAGGPGSGRAPAPGQRRQGGEEDADAEQIGARHRQLPESDRGDRQHQRQRRSALPSSRPPDRPDKRGERERREERVGSRDRQRRDERRPRQPDARSVAEIGRDVHGPLSRHQPLRRRDERIVFIRASALRLQTRRRAGTPPRSPRRPRTSTAMTMPRREPARWSHGRSGP